MGNINMTADERLALVRLKIERAEKHIADLRVAVQGFYKTNPYETAIKPNLGELGKLAWYVTRAAPVPTEIAAVTGDVLHNLRAALDHLAQQLYLVGSGSTSYSDRTSFHIAETPERFRAGLAGRVRGMRQDAIDAIRALEPYVGGQGAGLWVLHRLNNIDKHRLIVTVGSAFRSMDVGAKMGHIFKKSFPEWSEIPKFQLLVRPADRMFPLKAGDLVAGALEEEVNEKPPFRFEVAIHEPGVVEGKPLLETVEQFRNLVSGIIAEFKPCLA